MDSIRIVEEASEEYAHLRQERERRRILRRRVMNYIWVLCLAAACFFVCYTYMDYRIEGRTLLGRAKNVELAIRLVGIEYYGYGSTPYDSARVSNLKEEAEKEILDHAEAGGKLLVQEWDKETNEPTAFMYREGDFVVFYEAGADGKPAWRVCRLQNIVEAAG
ncbi:MAG: hypothetical protein K2P64_01365 [Lachnospiraceae bacterium]|nr:hypothetical protein [Lachnospiraceae bacterium]